ncbi:MAG TPA: SCO family protein [Pyrinomonadaceae bacterium]|nr:SCO family protein [Pyrinomonadaceae bacterium]
MKRKNAQLLLLVTLTISVPPLIISQLAAPVSFASFASFAQQQDPEYSCPMHPDVKSKKAGSCAKCGMTLKPKSAEPDSASSGGENSASSRFPNVELLTQDGKKVRFYDDLIKGKVVAIELMYTTCKYNCPLETARLVQVQKLLGDRMGKEVFFYSITIEPEIDTPKVLKAYAEKYRIGPGWTFLTGKEADIKLLSRKLGLDFLPNPNDPDGHTPSLLIGNDATGLWARNAALDNPKFLALKIEQMIGYGARPANTVAANEAKAVKLNIDKGQYLYATRCAACHTIGNGDKVGPDLLGVTNVRDIKWLRRIIMEPDKLIEEKDPLATSLFIKYKQIRMPRLGLPEADVNTLIEYMRTQSARVANREKVGTQN